jgi:hypothetical protein
MSHSQLFRRRPARLPAKAGLALLDELAGALTVHMAVEDCRFRVADQRALARSSRVRAPQEPMAIARGGLSREDDVRTKVLVLRQLIEESVGEDDAEQLLDAARIMMEESLASLGLETSHRWLPESKPIRTHRN